MKIISLRRFIVLFVISLLIFPHISFAETEDTPEFTEASVHDPSVIKVGDDYYVFGSHLAAAKTNDFLNWEQISTGVTSENPLFDNVLEELDEAFEWATKVSLWAPDVIQLDDGRFYMYYNAAEGSSPRSALGVAVADHVEGPYKDLGIFLKSGMWDEISEDGTIYDANIHPNAIDPHVFFDENQKLWMVYGSYSGGIFILEMDENTGFPLEGQGYGTKLIGGNHSRIEAPYIQYVPETGYYYLYITFGGLDAVGGYNMRVARSKNPDGPYFDAAGNEMTDVKGAEGTFFDDRSIEPYGVKLMGNYLFERNLGEPGTGIGTGYVSPGHNSVYYDEQTEEQYLIFHTRFPERGEEHEIRVHQMFMNDDGWPVVAPYRYTEEKLSTVSVSDVVGEYKFINHGKEITDEIKKSSSIQLESDGTITGDEMGTWEIKDEYEVSLNINGNSYNGVLLKQWNPTSQSNVMAFTALSQEGISVWGSKIDSKTDAEIIENVKNELDLGGTTSVMNDLRLPTDIGQGITIEWESSDPDIVTDDGVVTRPSVGSENKTVTITAFITKGSITETKEFEVTVLAESLSGLVAHYNFENDLKDQTGNSHTGSITGDKLDQTDGGSITFGDGKFGQAAIFDGMSGISLPNGLISSNQYSVSLWLNPAEITPLTTTFFGATSPQSWISLVPSGHEGANHHTMLWSGEAWYDAVTEMKIEENEWTHIAFTVNEGDLDIFINGENRYSGTGFPNIFTTDDAAFGLGVNYWDAPYKGLMDELLIYDNFVLSEEEIQSYYEDGDIPGVEKEKVDTTPLEELIKEAKQYKSDAFTEVSFANLQDAIEMAESAIDTIETQSELEIAKEALQKAIDELEEVSFDSPGDEEQEDDKKPDEIDKTKLNELIKQAQGIAADQYTDESYQALQNAIKIAEEAIKSLESESELSDAIAALQKAIDELEENAEEEEVNIIDDEEDAKTGNEEGESLPKTATSMYTMLLIGFILLAVGVIVFYGLKFRNKKA